MIALTLLATVLVVAVALAEHSLRQRRTTLARRARLRKIAKREG